MTQQEFLNRYHYNPSTDKLGAGGFGAVFKAYDTVYDREVAIKIASVIDGKENLSLMKEVELANNLPAHVNIVNYESCFRITGMEGSKDIGILQYYPEGSLATIIKKGNLSADEKAEIIRGILNGLQFLHEHNIMHRDMKPGNVLISKRGDQYIPKIADFGLSRQVESFEQSSFANSFVGGSAFYAAPEQLAGEKVHANVDLWSLGVILFELLTGERPFTATTNKSETENARLEIYGKIQRGELPEKVYTIAEPYQMIIRQCLVPDRRKRVKTASNLIAMMGGEIPNDLDLDRTIIETSFTGRGTGGTASVLEKGSKDQTKTFTRSSTTKVEGRSNKKLARGQKIKEYSSKRNRKLPVILGAVGAVVLAIVAYVMIPGGGSGLNEEQLWIQALGKKDSSSYIAILDAYPKGQYASEAAGYLDSIRSEVIAGRQSEATLLASVQQSNTLPAYLGYVNSYPAGLHLFEAKQSIESLRSSQSAEEAADLKKAEVAEDRAWARCQRKDEITVYQNYTRNYPSGQYVSEANDAIRTLQVARAAAEYAIANKEEPATNTTESNNGNSRNSSITDVGSNQAERVEEEEKAEVVEVEEDDIDIPFAIIESVPIFPGCRGSNSERKNCLNENLNKILQRDFNATIVNELGLDPGMIRIHIQFKIDKNGDVTNIRTRSPHPALEAEVIRVLKNIPKMQPGTQRGKPVGVIYALPIRLIVE